ncbi:MAG: M1 family aminopeptidase, partial [Pyrinomonadaceae bacterium]
FRERTQGANSFRSFMDDAASTYFNYEKTTRSPIHDTETVKLLDLLNPNNYQKGAWILHMLRGQLGEKDFFAGIREYYSKYRNGVATTEDLRRSLEKTSGQDLREFFTRWVYGAGHPDYRVTWRWLNGHPGRVTMMVTQAQPAAAFLTPITIEFVTGKTVRREVLVPTGKSTGANFRLTARPDQVRLDPDGFILKESTVTETRSSRR